MHFRENGKMRITRRQAEWSGDSIYDGEICNFCRTDRYYTCNGRCVECQRVYMKHYLSPKQKAKKLGADFSRQLKLERDRVQNEKSKNSQLHWRKRIKYPTMHHMSIGWLKNRVFGQQGHKCAYCGDGYGLLILDAISPTFKSSWANPANLQALCHVHKIAKWESGMQDADFRRFAGIPCVTQWDLI